MLENVDLLGGDRFTIAEITALVAIDVAALLGDIQIAPMLSNLTRWHQRVSSRPSASA
jgi:glutathione S-transferase